jgi:hypothetical protein
MTTFNNIYYTINGVIDTTQPAWTNIENLSLAAGVWFTFDIHTGKWAVIINRAGSSTASFNDGNILGAINITGTGVYELYNSVKVSFPNKLLGDEKDYVVLQIPDNQRFANEPLNTLDISTDLINDQIQAQMLGLRELKQSRVDKIIEFRTDYSYLGIKAGDIIDVTSPMYGFTNKKFRIVSVNEEDDEEGNIVLSITALEYSDGVYSFSDINYYLRDKSNGLRPTTNTAVTANNAFSNVGFDLTPTGKQQGLTFNYNSSSGRYELSQAGILVTINGSSAVLKWTYQDGTDLDIRCRVYKPAIGQTTVDQYLGWTGDGSTPPNTTSQEYWPDGSNLTSAIISWGGDNTGAGGSDAAVETVFLNIARFKTLYPNERYCVLECRGNWYGTRGIKPVLLTADVYEGGTIAESTTPNTFSFVNTGYTKGRFIDGVKVFVDSNSQSPTVLGDLMGYFVFDTTDNTAQFRNDLTGIE